MTSLLRQNDVILNYVKMTLFWRNNDVIITPCVQGDRDSEVIWNGMGKIDDTIQ